MRAIVVQTFGSSGSSLLHSLFDFHPQLLTLPSIACFDFYTKFRQFTAVLKGRIPTRDQLLAFARVAFDAVVNPTNVTMVLNGCTTLGPNRDQTSFIDQKEFLALFLKHLDLLLSPHQAVADVHRMRAPVLLAGYRAYAEATGQPDVERRTCIVFPFHGSPPDQAHDICADFTDVKVIHMMRDPVSLVDASLSHYARNIRAFPVLATVSPLYCAAAHTCEDIDLHWNLRTHHKSLQPLIDALADSSFVIRLEDLRMEPERHMRAIAACCGLDWSQSLLETTVGGKIWWNRAGSKQVAGFDKAMNKEFKSTTTFDRWRLGRILRPLRNRYGYARARWSDGIVDRLALLASLLPFKCESQYADDLRSYALFVAYILKKTPDVQSALLGSLAEWLTARSAIIASRPDLHVLNDQLLAQDRALAVRAMRETGTILWRFGTFLGGLRGYYLDRSYGFKMFKRIRADALEKTFVRLFEVK